MSCFTFSRTLSRLRCRGRVLLLRPIIVRSWIILSSFLGGFCPISYNCIICVLKITISNFWSILSLNKFVVLCETIPISSDWKCDFRLFLIIILASNGQRWFVLLLYHFLVLFKLLIVLVKLLRCGKFIYLVCHILVHLLLVPERMRRKVLTIVWIVVEYFLRILIINLDLILGFLSLSCFGL